jgi:hypothetical protein
MTAILHKTHTHKPTVTKQCILPVRKVQVLKSIAYWRQHLENFFGVQSAVGKKVNVAAVNTKNA